MSGARPQPNEAQWLAHKSFIRQEYLFRDAPLKMLMESLAARGLQVTKAQLEYKLKKWQFSKNLDKQSWQYIERTISRRENQKKKSEVLFRGRRIERLKVLKETRRHSETSIFKQLTVSGPTSPSNSDLIVRTPPPFEMNVDWPDSLPWLRFLNEYWNSAQDAFKTGDLAIAQAVSSDLVLKVLGYRSWIQSSRATLGASELTSILTTTMPEWYVGEHFNTAQSLISGPDAQSALELFRILIYKTSNGIHRIADAEWLAISVFLRSCLIYCPLNVEKLRADSTVFQAFFDNLFKQEVLSRITGHQYGSLWPLNTIQWLLKSGQDPNCCLNGIFGHFKTTIGQAVEIGDIELVQLLLDGHVRIHNSQPEFELRALIDAVLSGFDTDASKLRTLRFLSGYYKYADWKTILNVAIFLSDIGLVRYILGQNPDATVEHIPTTWGNRHIPYHAETYLEFSSTLTSAAIAGDDLLTLMLDHLESSGRLANSITVDLLIAAAFKRDAEIVRRLLKARTLSITRNSMGATPLQAAVAGGNLPVCELFVELYGGVSPAIIALAACRGHEEVLSMLIDSSNCVNEPLTDQDLVGFMDALSSPASPPRKMQFSILETTIDQCLDSTDADIENCLTILIEAGARFKGGEIATLAHRGMEGPLRAALAAGGSPDDRCDEGFSALQYALYSSQETENVSVIVDVLLQAKARLVGGEVVAAIRNHDEDSTCLEAAILAQNGRRIQQILEEGNDTIDLSPICAALQKGNRALVQRLLPRLHVQANCVLVQGAAIGLAAASGYLEILEELHVRSSQQVISYEALVPLYRATDGRLSSYGRVGGGNLGAGLKSIPFTNIRSYKCGQSTLFQKGSPLALAALGENSSGFQRLLEKGYPADIMTLTILAERNVDTGFVELLEIHQPRLDNLSLLPKMITPLCIAIEKGNTLLINYLVEAGMDVNAYDKTLTTSYSPLQGAVQEGNLFLTGYLITKGASVNSPPSIPHGLTALQAAAKGGHIGLANMLLQHGARVNARGARHQGSALELAARSGNIDMIELLLHHGAITTGPGREQFVTAVACAMKRAYHTAAQFLKGKCGWTTADESLLRHPSMVRKDHFRYSACKICCNYCCGEIHSSDTPCIHDYSAEEEKYCVKICRTCNEPDISSESGSEEDTPSDASDVEDIGSASSSDVSVDWPLDSDDLWCESCCLLRIECETLSG
ncbi:hypothetical protein DER45DRAFT_646241 [Fusarium avenaceum]|nr:hypothetical protein DER45DRAFT_646241 [Fusarium avenaceum]